MSRVSAGEAEVREKQEEVIGSGEVGAVEIKGRHGARTGSSREACRTGFLEGFWSADGFLESLLCYD